ncbi:FemAB family XrtA/PEP-CTERM system-associated protein [Rhodoferax ferrireducens]|uniref:FemAB family XrtA/PEP-CTERM system-associated protein n=1 Tax=Rhodoferax ferrireducens TaxID=192843 RepID=UPI003864C585
MISTVSEPAPVLLVKRLVFGDIATAKRWDAFVSKCSTATFFHLAGWQNVIRRVFRHDTYFLYVEVNGEIEGVLPLAHVNSFLFGNSISSLPFAVYGGCAASSSLAVDALEKEAKEIAVQLKVSHLEFRNTVRRHQDWPLQDLYVTFRKEILGTEEENLLAVPRKQRAMIRKGIKNSLTSEIDSDVQRFFSLYADNVHRHGTPAMPRSYFQALIDEFGDSCEILTISSVDGRPLSSVFSFYFRDEVLPYYAGDDLSARELAANDFKYWELMRRACLRGLKVFDYGRSKNGTGSFSFKKNWGFEPTPLSYEYCLYRRDDVPQNNPSNAKYKFLISAWRCMPISMANAIGPFIVRSLG